MEIGAESDRKSDQHRIEIGSSDQNRIEVGSRIDIGPSSDRNRIDNGSKPDRNRIKNGSKSDQSHIEIGSISDHDLDPDPLFCLCDFPPLPQRARATPCQNFPPHPKSRQLFSKSKSWRRTGGSGITFSRDVLLCPFSLVVSLH